MKDFYVFDPGTNAWTQIASIPGIGRIAPFGLVLNGNMVVGWGADEGSTNYNDYFRYNASANTWTSYSYTTNPCLFASVFFEINGKGYVGSGTYQGTCVNDFYEFTDISGTGIDNVQNSSAHVLIFPNPIKESATISISGIDFQNSKAEIQFFDETGKIVWSEKISSSIITFERGGLPTGIYFYKAMDGNVQVASGQLVMQ